MGASLLHGLGLDGLLVARTLSDYVQIAILASTAAGPATRSSLASPKASQALSQWGGRWLRGAREQLAAAKTAAPLFDVDLWVRAMEAAVRAAYEVDAAASSTASGRSKRTAVKDLPPAAMHVAVSSPTSVEAPFGLN